MTPERGRHPGGNIAPRPEFQRFRVEPNQGPGLPPPKVCNRCVVVAGRAYCCATHFLGAEAMAMAKECRFWRAPLDGYARDCEHQHRGFNLACRSKQARETAERRGHP